MSNKRLMCLEEYHIDTYRYMIYRWESRTRVLHPCLPHVFEFLRAPCLHVTAVETSGSYRQPIISLRKQWELLVPRYFLQLLCRLLEISAACNKVGRA